MPVARHSCPATPRARDAFGLRYLSKAVVNSILDQISKMRGVSQGGGSCIVCDTVSSSSLLCREKWHGHFTWGVNLEVLYPEPAHFHPFALCFGCILKRL